jgi:molybdopterin molybdotransferase
MLLMLIGCVRVSESQKENLISSLTPVPEAIAFLLEYFSVLETENIHLRDAAGRTLAKPMYATLPLPPFDASSVDGFALRSQDVDVATADNPTSLKVIGDIPAGSPPHCNVRARQAARIMTGAVLPEGADAVVMVEDTDYGVRSAGTPLPNKVQVMRSVSIGENIRARGQDISLGEQVLRAKHNLRPQDLGMLAMLGMGKIPVIRYPRVGIITPGDELITVGGPLSPGKIYESNSYMLRSLVESGGAKTLELGIVADNYESIKDCLDGAIANGVDLFISTGGVSVGAYDYVLAILKSDDQLKLWRVNMRPGKPLAFGHYHGVPFIGLPGNPVSAYISYQVFVQPVLRKMLGMSRAQRMIRRVQLQEAINSDGRESYLRAVVTFEDDRWIANLTGPQGSGNLQSLVQANALLIVPAGVKNLPAGSKVDAWFYSVEHLIL